MSKVKIILAMMLCAIMLTGSMQTVYAADLDEEVDPDDYVLLMEQMQSDGSGAAARDSIRCYAKLEPLSAYEMLQATSYLERGEHMDQMIVTCSGFYESGAQVGKPVTTDLNRGQVLKASAVVSVPESSFPLKIYSGFSTHIFRRSGYKTVTLECTWKKK